MIRLGAGANWRRRGGQETRIEPMAVQHIPQPVLFTSNLTETAAFFEDFLDFSVMEKPCGLLMRREMLTLAYCIGDRSLLDLRLSVILPIDNVRELHDEYREVGVPVMTELRTSYRAPHHFTVVDLNGNELIFTGHRPALTVHSDGSLDHNDPECAASSILNFKRRNTDGDKLPRRN